ncbi:MAG: hypothetical protein RBR86_00305 [Pseudobdellovibrionaceae bacterium]|jgi:hypothetical protein|nr:hypothetical protein [Pseudobdellovibrionaceae bacterium]
MNTQSFKICSLLIACSFALGACVSGPSPESMRVKLLSPDQASMCRDVGNIQSRSVYYGVFTDTTKDKLSDLAKESANRLGATHVVLQDPVLGDNEIIQNGKAYICPQ